MPRSACKLVSALARAAGLGGMVGGQMLDLAAEGRFDASPPRLGEQDVKTLQAMKTGALLRFGCLAGAILGKANQGQWTALDRYGSALGEAFQIADDLLDLEGDPATVGKATGKDAAAHKATHGRACSAPAAAKRRLDSLVAEAQAALEPVRQRCRRAQGRGALRRDTQRLKLGDGVAAESGARHLVQLGGLEPPTSGSTDRRSNQLSYSCTSCRERPQTRSTVLL